MNRREAVRTSTNNLCFEQKYEQYKIFYLKTSVFGGVIFNIFEQAYFHNENRFWNTKLMFPLLVCQSYHSYHKYSDPLTSYLTFPRNVNSFYDKKLQDVWQAV